MHPNTCLLFPNILLGLMKNASANSLSVCRRDTALETITLPTGHTQFVYHGIFPPPAAMPQPTGTGA